MSVSLSQKLDDNIKLRDKLFIAFENTDEIFAVSMGNEGKIGKRYMLGLLVAPWLGWSSGTIIGAFAGAALPEIITVSLGVAIYAMLIAVVVPKIKEDKNCAVCVFLAVALSCAFNFLPFFKGFTASYGGFVIIICAVVAGTVMAIAHPIEEEGTANEC